MSIIIGFLGAESLGFCYRDAQSFVGPVPRWADAIKAKGQKLS